MGSLTDEDIERLRKLAPDIVAKIEAPPDEDEEDPLVFVDQPVLPLVTESGEARDMDTVLPDTVCPACERGGPRRGAPHTCGLPTPHFAPRQEHG